MKSLLIVFVALAVLGSSPAHAQMKIDVAKISCHQFLFGLKVSKSSISNWLSGYFNGKSGNTEVDIAELMKNTRDLERYCVHHRDTSVMDAAKNVIGKTQ
jgi:acid stress chaperone HdeB